jgi:outer membrane protein
MTTSVSFASSQNLPLYEIGIAGAALSVQDYPAADQSHTKYLLLPTFIYRGDLIRSDKGGVSANFFKSDRLKLDLSIGASLPSSAKDNKARSGMNDLDLLMEIGPSLTYIIATDKDYSFKFSLPVRMVTSTDIFFTKQRGRRINPEFRLRMDISEHWGMGMTYEWHYGTEDLTDYFYEVTKGDVTSEREQYNAKEGFIGQSFGGYIRAKYGKVTSFIGVSLNQYHQSVNEDSPLFRNRLNTNIFFGFNYFFHHSQKMSKSGEKEESDL